MRQGDTPEIGTSLAASVQISGPVDSHYWWRGEQQHAQEFLCVALTEADRYERLQRAVLDIHPYETPQIIATAIACGAPAFLAWISEYTRDPTDRA